jgi:enterochelin esterase-like enzyme
LTVLLLFASLVFVEASPSDQRRIDKELRYLQEKLDDWPAKAQGEQLQELRRRFQDTARALEELAKQRPLDAGVAWRLGECYRMANNIEIDEQYVAASKESLDRALEIDPDYVPAYVSLGKLAIQAYRKMLFEKEGEVPWSMPFVAQDYFEEALERSGARVDPDIYKGLSYVPHYANISHSPEKVAEAIELGERYLRSRPEDAAFQRTWETYRIKRKLLEERTQVQEQTIVLPPTGYDADTAYPVLIYLPYTGGTALRGFITYVPVMEIHDFILVLPPGKGSTADHSWEGFSACIERYEAHIEEALEWIRSKYRVDEERIILAGYSLGGDLSWALSVRTPDRYRGAIMMGTRCGYRAGEQTLEKLRGGDFRAFFLTGADELPARYDGMNQAKQLLQSNGIETLYREVPGAHTRANVQAFKQALDFLLR